LKDLFRDLKLSGVLGTATFMDKLLFIVLTVLAVSGFFFTGDLFPSGSRVEITLDNKTVYVLPLNEDRTVEVTGPLGKNLIEIKNGLVRMKDAPCPERLCIHQGWTDKGAIVCLPNRVAVWVSGDEQRHAGSEYDAVSK